MQTPEEHQPASLGRRIWKSVLDATLIPVLAIFTAVVLGGVIIAPWWAAIPSPLISA